MEGEHGIFTPLRWGEGGGKGRCQVLALEGGEREHGSSYALVLVLQTKEEGCMVYLR